MNTHYYKRYIKIIDFYKTNIHSLDETIFEKHHIIPKCMGGSNDKTNLVKLPPRVHFICHMLLYKSFPENRSLAHAFAMMAVNNHSQNRKIKSSILYDISKKARSSALKGIPRSEEVKAKLRKPKSDTSKYFGNTNGRGVKGKKMPVRSKEHSQKINDSKKEYFEKLKKEKQERIEHYRNKFIELNVSRKEFYMLYPEFTCGTLKGYLKGL